MKTYFALYLIPSDGPMYRVGSSLLGYDIRHHKAISLPDFISPEWQSSAARFGFHVTITDAIETTSNNLADVTKRIGEVLSCLRPTNEYLLKKDRVGFWRETSGLAVILTKPNRNVELLHDVLVTGVTPLGKGSEYFDSYQQDAINYAPHSDTDIQRTKLFYSPFIFDDFIPHFTCIGSYNGPADARRDIDQRLGQLFRDMNEIEFDTVALVTRSEDEQYFHIEKEFSLHGESQDHAK